MRSVEEIKAVYDRRKINLENAVKNKNSFESAICNRLLEESKTELISAITKSIPIERLEAICNAEREGRCVPLPCKVWDRCYYRFAQCITGSQVLGIRSPDIVIVEMIVQSIALRGETFWISDGDRYSGELGKTVFLTREAAEAALEAQNA